MRNPRVVTQPHRAGEQFLRDQSDRIGQLEQASLSIDDQGRLLLGPMYLYAQQNPDDSVTVFLQNAITDGQPVTLARLT